MPVLVPVLLPVLLPALLLAEGGRAQRWTAAAFRPETPQMEIRVDFARLRDRGIWDLVEHSLLVPLLQMAEKEMGFGLGDLDDFRVWVHVPAPAGDGEGAPAERRPPVHRAVAFQGAVAFPPASADWTEDEIGGQPVRWQGSEFGALAGGAVLAIGSRELIEPILRGERKGGLPCAEELSLLASREQPLLHLYADLDAARRADGGFGFLTEIEYPAGDEARHLMIRLDSLGDVDEQQLVLKATVRHARGEEGRVATQSAAREWIDEMKGHRQLGALQRIWSAIEFEREGTDLHARLVLGSPREALGTVAQVLVPIFALREMAQVEAQRAELEAVRAAVEARKKEIEKELEEMRRREQAERGKGGSGGR